MVENSVYYIEIILILTNQFNEKNSKTGRFKNWKVQFCKLDEAM